MEANDNPRKKKILFIVTKSVWGGAQRYVVDLIEYLPRDEFDFAVAAGGRGPLAAKAMESGVPYYEIESFQRDISLRKEILAFFELLAIIRKTKPDIVHLNSSKAAGTGAVAAWLMRVPRIVASTHGWPFHEDLRRWQRLIRKLLVKIGILFQDAVICVSEFDYNTGIQIKIAPRKKLVPIHNGVDQKKHVFLERARAREELFRRAKIEAKNYFIIGTIAEYTKNKGLYYLLEAANQIIKVEPRAIFMLVGWGEEREFLRETIEKFHLEKHVFLIENLPEAFSYLKAFDVFILPSLKEGFAYTLLEASLAELPIVTTRVGGNPEIIENLKNGILINSASPEEIISAISYLMRDASDRMNLGAAARAKVVKDFSIESMVRETQRVYLGK